MVCTQGLSLLGGALGVEDDEVAWQFFFRIKLFRQVGDELSWRGFRCVSSRPRKLWEEVLLRQWAVVARTPA